MSMWKRIKVQKVLFGKRHAKTFDEFFKEHQLTKEERRELKFYLIFIRMVKMLRRL